MAIAPGTQLGPYEIVALIGAGAMGEVYRARDGKLGRNVAIKVLAPAFTADPDRLARFEREARSLAALNHPSIATIHGLEETGDVRALVMELVEGETLTERIARSSRGTGRSLPAAEALRIAQRIAEALDAAHAHGIVHRDLKPDNVMVTPAGAVKVLDFGIAKIRDPNATDDRSAAATTAAGRTLIGTVLGTAAYMSPEQARGLPVDKRTDVWAFGCVLYELLTGRAPFDGATVTDTLAAVLEREPDWQRLPAAVPAPVRRLLHRCLQKDLHRRLRDAGDIAMQLEDALAAPERATAPEDGGSPARARRRALAVAGAALLLAATGFVAARYFEAAPEPATAPVTRLSISTPWPVIPPTGTAVSPDGRSVVFVAADASGEARLVLRALDSVEVRTLPGTEYARHPFWSPDGRSLGFWANGQIKRADVAGSPVRAVVEARIGGGTWSKDDIVVFERETGLWAVPAGGGTPVEVTTAEPVRETHTWPHFLPDGRRFLYFIQSIDPERRGVYVGSLDSRDAKLVLKTDFQARYAPPGYLLFIRDEQLLAQPFDLERLELTGQPAIVADGVWVAALAGRATFSASDNGTLAYINASLWNTQLAWFDRRGALLGELGPPDRYGGQSPELSPDGGRVAIARGLWSREQVWILDANDGTATRFTFGGLRAVNPIWSGDARRVMYEVWTGTGGERHLAIKDVGGGETETVDLNAWPFDWTADGRFAVYQQGTTTDGDLWALPLEGERTPIALTQTPHAYEFQAQLSPDDRWLVYVSNESGRDEVYVQRFPDGGGKRQVSPAGGAAPRWRPDGTELYYVAPDGYLTAVAVRDRATFELSAPTPLFRSQVPYLEASNPAVRSPLAVTADGQRFLMNIRPDVLTAPITVVGNWPAAL